MHIENRQARTYSNRNHILRDINSLEITKLEQHIDLILRRNTEKYKKIIETEVNYHVNLYEPNQKLKTQKAFKKQLLLKQIDKLMDQQAIFDKKLTQINFMKEEQNQRIQQILSRQMNPYQVLRTVWARHQKNTFECKDSSQRIESLNFTIGTIKSAILNMKQKQQKPSLEHEMPKNHKQSTKYEKLLVKYERSLMENQQMRLLINKLQTQIDQKIQNQKVLTSQILQRQRQLKQQRKIKDINELDHKLFITQLKQQIHTISKKLDKLEKWKFNLQKNTYENKIENFKIYIQNNDANKSKNQDICCYTVILKPLSQILINLTENQKIQSNSYKINPQSQITSHDLINTSLHINNPEFLTNQQNTDLNIPTLNISSSNKQICMRKKMSTDRPLKAANYQLQRFLGSKFTNIQSNIQPNRLSETLNQESMKKFIRKNKVPTTTRRLESQYSQRSFQQFNQAN